MNIEITQEFLQKAYDELLAQQDRMRVYKNYYDGNHDILYNYRMQNSRSNMKVIVNWFKKFIDDEVAYALGNPINYIDTKIGEVQDAEDNTAINLIDLSFSHWAKAHDQKLLKEAQKFGFAYELKYLNSESEFKTMTLTPLECYAIEDGTAEHKIVFAIRVFEKDTFTGIKYMDVYYDNKIYHYEMAENGINDPTTNKTVYTNEFEKIGESTHQFLGVPIKICEANSERKSMLDDIKSMIDAYNNVLSDLVNETSDFRNAFIKVIGATIEPEEAEKMKEKGIVECPDGSDIGFLIKQINDTFIQNLLKTLHDNIHKAASHIDTNEKLQSNLSGVALRSRLISLENKCSTMATMLEQTIAQRLKQFFHIQRIRTGQEYDYRKIKVKFTPNIPADLLGLADIISKLKEVVSHTTLLSLLPFIENPEAEKAKFDAEQGGMIDLDSVQDEEIEEGEDDAE